MLEVAKCLHFVMAHMEQNKKRKQYLQSAQYGLEIIFKNWACRELFTCLVPLVSSAAVIRVGSARYSSWITWSVRLSPKCIDREGLGESRNRTGNSKNKSVCSGINEFFLFFLLFSFFLT